MTELMIAVGAAIGAPARYLTDLAVQAGHDTVFPWGTLTVNVVASLVLGVVSGAGSAHLGPHAWALVATGFCGALSTYSTFSLENQRLVEEGAVFHAAANIVVSLVAGIGAAAFGWSLGAAMV